MKSNLILPKILTVALLLVFLFALYSWLPPISALLLILIICLGAVMFFNPLVGLLLLILIRPSLDILTDYPVIILNNLSLNLSSLLAVLTLVFAVFVILKNQERLKAIPLRLPIIIFLILAFVSTLLSYDVITSLAEMARLMSIFSLYALGFILAQTKKELGYLVKTIIFSALVPGLFAVYQFITDTGMTISTEEIYNRIFGTFAHPNLLAYYLIIPLALLVFTFSKDIQQKNPNIFYPLAILYFIILLILTYTRGAWLAFLLIIFVIGITKYRKFLIVSAVVVFLIYAAIEPIRIRVDNLMTSDPGSSVQWRLGLWKDSVIYVSEAPILGHGTGTANELILEKRGIQFGSSDPHNDYLKILLENGELGLIAYLFIIISLIISLFKKYKEKHNAEIRNFLLIIIGLSLALYIMSFADNIIRNTALQWAYWSLIGSVFAISSINKRLEK
jgi:putative inorganic carbon (hco3(-)) transporter